MLFEFITPEGTLESLEGDEITMPTPSGRIGVRYGHIPLITLLAAGEVVVKKDNEKSHTHIAIGRGIARITGTKVEILSRSADTADDLDESAIQAAIERAKEAHKNAQEDHELADAAAIIEANLARLKVAKRKKAHSHHSQSTDSTP